MDSSLLRSQDPNSIVWKITGRYRIANVDQLIRYRPRQFDFYCNCRNYPVRLTDQFLQAWRIDAYSKHLSGLYENFKESEAGKYGEQVMRDIIDSGRLSGLKIVPRFRQTPIVHGVRGWDNAEYSVGFKNGSKLIIRRAASVVAPWLWI